MAGAELALVFALELWPAALFPSKAVWPVRRLPSQGNGGDGSWIQVQYEGQLLAARSQTGHLGAGSAARWTQAGCAYLDVNVHAHAGAVRAPFPPFVCGRVSGMSHVSTRIPCSLFLVFVMRVVRWGMHQRPRRFEMRDIKGKKT